MEYKDYAKSGNDKGKQKDWVPVESKRRVSANHIAKQALASWEDSSSASDKSEHPKDVSMMVVDDNDNVFNLLIAIMEKLDDNDEN